MDARGVAEHILQRARWTASLSSGPGGQRRDKVATRAELTVDFDALDGLDPSIASRLADRLGLRNAPLRIASQEARSLVQNQRIAADRLAELVADALAPPPPPRRPTRPSRGQREARLAEKSIRGTVKRLRQTPTEH